MERKCLYCEKSMEGLRPQAKFCCENHKDYFNTRRRKKEQNAIVKELKEKFPFLWDINYEWSEKDVEYINWCANNLEKVEKLIFNQC